MNLQKIDTEVAEASLMEIPKEFSPKVVVTPDILEAGLKFDPVTGEASKPLATFDSEGSVTVTWTPTGYTFLINNHIVGPEGVDEKAGITAFATKETADKMLAFARKSFSSDVKVEQLEADWSAFQVLDIDNKPVPQYQVKISRGNSTATHNAGLMASSVIHSGESAAADLLNESLK